MRLRVTPVVGSGFPALGLPAADTVCTTIHVVDIATLQTQTKSTDVIRPRMNVADKSKRTYTDPT
jgi:hypothetical protein